MNRHRADGEHTAHLHVAPAPDPPGDHRRGRVPGMWWRRVEHARTLLAIVALILGIILMGSAIALGVGVAGQIARIGDQLSATPAPNPVAPPGPEFTGCGPDNTAPC